MTDYTSMDLAFWQAHAPFYDLYSTGEPGDLKFYMSQVQESGGPVLEIGCGTGRLIIPMAEAGVKVVGLDRSEAMLDLTRQKVAQLSVPVQQRIQLIHGDMRDFSLDHCFPLITIPYRGFQHLYTPDDQRRALTNLHRHLTDEGRLVFDVIDPRLDYWAEQFALANQYNKGEELLRLPSGERVVVWHQSRFDAEEQLLEQRLIFRTLNHKGETLTESHQHFRVRFTYRYEMQHLLELCGFTVESLYADFQCNPFRSGAQQVWVARQRR